MTTGSFPIRWAAAFLPVHRLGRLCGEGAAARRGLWVSLLVVMLSTGWAATAQADRIPIATFEIGPSELPEIFDGVAAVNNISGSLIATIDVPVLTFVDVSLTFCDGSVRPPAGDVSMVDAIALCSGGSAFLVPLGPLGPHDSLKYDYGLGELPTSSGTPWLFVFFALDQASEQRLGAGRLVLDGVVALDCREDDCVRTVYFEPVPEPATLALLTLGLCGLATRCRFRRG